MLSWKDSTSRKLSFSAVSLAKVRKSTKISITRSETNTTRIALFCTLFYLIAEKFEKYLDEGDLVTLNAEAVN